MGPYFLASCNRITDNGFKLKEGMFRIDIKKKFLIRVVKDWHTLPREVVDASSLKILKPSLDGAPYS